MCAACGDPTGDNAEMTADANDNDNEKTTPAQTRRSNRLPKNISPKLRQLLLAESEAGSVLLRLEYRSENQYQDMLPRLDSMGIEILSHQVELRQVTARAPATEIRRIAELEGVVYLDGLSRQRR